MVVLYLVWLLLAAIFFSFSYMFWRQLQTPLRPFQIRQRAGQETAKSPETEQAINELVHDMNSYLETVGASLRSQNRAAAVGSLIAGLVALVSMVITIAKTL